MGQQPNRGKGKLLGLTVNRAPTIGQMAGYLKEHGRRTICMGEEYIPGKMVGNMMESILMTKNTVSGNTLGLMGEFTKASGRTANNTAKENTYFRQEWKEKAIGRKASV